MSCNTALFNSTQSIKVKAKVPVSFYSHYYNEIASMEKKRNYPLSFGFDSLFVIEQLNR